MDPAGERAFSIGLDNEDVDEHKHTCGEYSCTNHLANIQKNHRVPRNIVTKRRLPLNRSTGRFCCMSDTHHRTRVHVKYMP